MRIDADGKAGGSKVRPYTDVHNAAALYERGVATYDRGEYTAAGALWHKAKRSPRELENP